MKNHEKEERKVQPQVVPFRADKRLSWCFGCGRDNPSGLKLDFHWDGKIARVEFTPPRFYQSWPGIVHGGIIATMLDEAMGHATRFSGISDFLTAAIQVNFRRPAPVGKLLVITGWVTGRGRRSIKVAAKATLPDGTLLADGKGTQVIIAAQGNNHDIKEES